MNIVKKLHNLPREALVLLLVDLYERYADIEEIIDSFLENAGPEGVADAAGVEPLGLYLGRQIEDLTTSREFFHYREAQILYDQCERVVQGVSELAKTDAGQALALLDVLLSRHGQICERVDDSC